jgi:hypothetical protein
MQGFLLVEIEGHWINLFHITDIGATTKKTDTSMGNIPKDANSYVCATGQRKLYFAMPPDELSARCSRAAKLYAQNGG